MRKEMCSTTTTATALMKRAAVQELQSVPVSPVDRNIHRRETVVVGCRKEAQKTRLSSLATHDDEESATAAPTPLFLMFQ